MMKCKKVLLIVLLLLVVFPLTSSAADLNASEYGNMEAEIKYNREIMQRIADGEDIIYSQDGTIIDLSNYNGGIMPYWGSSNPNKVHQWMVNRAIEILENDFGAGITAPFDDVGIYHLTLGADVPDVEETDFFTFAGHFYNPITGKNHLGATNPTALTRFTYWANSALGMWYMDKAMALSYLGRALHYLGDLSAPHHVHNMTVLNSDHFSFEGYADSNKDNHKLYYGSKYNIGGSWNLVLSSIAHSCATDTYRNSTFALENGSYSLQNWSGTLDVTLKTGQNYMAAFLYRFLVEVGEI